MPVKMKKTQKLAKRSSRKVTTSLNRNDIPSHHHGRAVSDRLELINWKQSFGKSYHREPHTANSIAASITRWLIPLCLGATWQRNYRRKCNAVRDGTVHTLTQRNYIPWRDTEQYSIIIARTECHPQSSDEITRLAALRLQETVTVAV